MTQIKPGIHWIGGIERGLKYFHGHELSISRGTSYNAYLIIDEKIALIDSVKYTHTAEFVENLQKLIPIEKIDYFVVNHGEPDHSSALPALMKLNPNAQVIVSRGGEKSVSRFYPGKWNFKVVKTSDSISLGKRSLKFFEAPMLHWPDSMFSYCPEEKMLFPNDAFGQHYAASTRFADEADQCELWQEAEKYFANILTPFSGQIIKKIDEFLKLNWSIEMICPSHGLIWRKDPTAIVTKYLDWASGKASPTAVVIYDSIWGGTERMAKAICRGIESEGISMKLFTVGVADFNDVMTEILKARGVLIGSPTLNNGLIPTITPYLESIRGLRFVKKVGAVFGTYGWSGEAIKRMEDSLQAGQIELVLPGLKVNFNPVAEDLIACESFGAEFARRIRKC